MDTNPELAVLELVPFGGQPYVNFNNVKLGTTRISYVVLRNSKNAHQQLVVKSFPKEDKGIYMDAAVFIIAPHTEICVAIAWTPKTVGSLRDSITLQNVKKMSWRIVLMGTAIRPKPAPPTVTRSNIPRLFRRSPSKTNKKTLFTQRVTTNGNIKPLTRLIDESPMKRHQLVRNILAQRLSSAAIVIQKHIRGFVARRKFQAMKRAALMIQKYSRGFLARRKIQATKRAALVIQKNFRGFVARRKIQATKRAALVIQKYSRGFVARRKFQAMKRAALVIQKYSRGFVARRKFQAMKRAALMIQKYSRGFVARRKFKAMKRAALVIQKYSRGYLIRRDYQSVRRATIIIQSQVRMYLLRRKYLKTIEAMDVLRAHFERLTGRMCKLGFRDVC